MFAPGKCRWRAPRATQYGLCLLALLLCASACQTTRYYERRKLVAPCMQIDGDRSLLYIRNKIEAAREGALGAFGASASGSCGCQ